MKRCLLFLALIGCRAPAPAVVKGLSPSEGPTGSIRQAAKKLGLRFPLRYVLLRALKEEKRLELWASDDGMKMNLVRDYPIAAASGHAGPKRREGDAQVPEGVYRIDRFNPKSQFHLSLGLDYPNSSDRRRGALRPGGDIFIHGNRVSIGCLAITDGWIDEIYPACENALNRKSIAVHIFPCRMEGPVMASLKRSYPEHVPFWRELRPIYDSFQRTRRAPTVKIDRSGAYILTTPRPVRAAKDN